MTIRKRLALNLAATIIGIITIGSVAVLSLNAVKDKISAMTEKSTPVQVKTLELTRQLQEHAVNLFAISSSVTEGQLKSAAQEALNSLGKVERAVGDLQRLKGEGGVAPATLSEVRDLTKDMIATTADRLRVESEASQATSLSRARLADTLLNLDRLQESMKRLQDGSAASLTRSSRNSREITAGLSAIQKTKDSVQELQIALTEIDSARTASVLNSAKGRIRFALQNIFQNEKKGSPLLDPAREFGKMTLDSKGLVEMKETLLAQPHAEKQESELKHAFQQSRNKLDNIVMLVNESLDGASLSYQAENISLDGTIKTSEEVRRITGFNSELVAAASSVQNMASTLIAGTTADEVVAAATRLAEKLKAAQAPAMKIEGSLTAMGGKGEIPLIRQVSSSFRDIGKALTGPQGVADKLGRAIEAKGRASEMNTRLAKAIQAQKEKGGKTMSAAYEAQAEAAGTVNLVVKGATVLVLVLSLAVLAAGIGLGRITAGAVMRPVGSLTALARRIGSGDFSTEMKVQGNDEFRSVATDFNHASSEIQVIAEDLSGLSNRLAASSAHLTTTADRLARNAADQAGETGRALSAVTEMSRSNSRIAERARVSASHASEMRRLALEGNASLRETSADLLGFADTVSALGEKMEALSGKSHDVQGISALIRDIADQTNLLALNASIEAARAGDGGRGFAVVAANVRDLAERVAVSTGSITALTDGIETELGSAMKSMEKQKHSIARLLTLISGTTGTMESIVSSVEQVSDMVEETAAAAEHHSLTSSRIEEAMATMSSATGALRQAVLEIEGQAKGLVTASGDIDHKIKWFKTAPRGQEPLLQEEEPSPAPGIRAGATLALQAWSGHSGGG